MQRNVQFRGGYLDGVCVQAKKKRCDASVISSSTLIPFYLLLLTIYVSPYLHKTAPHHMNRTELTPEPITVSSHPSIPLFSPSFTV